VPVVQVRVVRVTVDHRRVPVHVDVRLTRGIIRPVRVAMVLVVHVGVLVNHLLVPVPVLVVLDDVQVEADPHQRGRRDQARAQRLAE
jgi:hypothetical protein